MYIINSRESLAQTITSESEVHIVIFNYFY